MDCGANTIELQEPDGTMRGIEIIPEGCEPVSEDVCKSGYMAPTENVSFPENSLKQCCKCKEGEACKLCVKPNACTEKEKGQFVTTENCFGTSIESPEEEVEDEAEEESDDELNLNYYIMIAAIILFIFFTILFTRRSKSF